MTINSNKQHNMKTTTIPNLAPELLIKIFKLALLSTFPCSHFFPDFSAVKISFPLLSFPNNGTLSLRQIKSGDDSSILHIHFLSINHFCASFIISTPLIPPNESNYKSTSPIFIYGESGKLEVRSSNIRLEDIYPFISLNKTPI